MPLFFITGNQNKFREVASVIPGVQQLNLELDEIQSLDPKLVIEHKLEQAADRHSGAFIVEDTSLVLHCMSPLPGPLVKWFLEALGPGGLAEVALRYPDHGATASVTIGYRDEQKQTRYFTASHTGEIVEPRGENGFGFDPIFLAHGQTQTNAEMTIAQKNSFSARGAAARQLAEHLRSSANS